MAALPHDETRHDVHAEVDEPSASLAWRILTSPRTFGVLAATMAVLLVVASLIPQRASVQELSHVLPFAFASAVHDLGLDDVLVSWPFLLLVLLMVLNLAGLWLASRLGASHAALFATRAEAQVETSLGELEGRLLAAMGGRVAVTKDRAGAIVATRGFVREGLVVVGFGVATLLAALAVSRGSGLDGRLALIPGATTLPESTVRDGDLMLLRQLPLGLFCGRPDPQDPSRTFPCRAAHAGSAPVTVALTPGQTSHVGAFALTPLTESLRVPRDTDPVDVVLYRDGAIERLSLEPGNTVELKRGGERVTALPGPDGPLVVLQQVVDGKPAASLLMPSAAPAAAGLRIEVEHPTTVTIAATTSPEWPLVLAGLGLVVLGLLLAAALPHLEVTLSSVNVPTAARPAAGPRHSGPERASDTANSGAAIEVRSLNRKALVQHTLAKLTQAVPASATSWLGPVRADLWGTVSTLVLAGLGVALGLMAAPSSPVVPVALAAFVALGTRVAPLLGAVALVVGLGTAPDPMVPGLFDVLAMVGTGLGLGMLGRWLAEDEVSARSPLVLAGLCALALSLLHLLPAPALQAVTGAGEPLAVTATLADGASAMRVQWPVAVFEPGGANVLAPVLWLGLVVAVALFALHQRPHDKRARLVAQVAVAFGGLAVVAGALGLLQLFGSGSTEAEVLRHRLDLAATGATAFAAPTTSWELRLWSRPFLDGLTLLLGLAVVMRVWPLARSRPNGNAVVSQAGPAGLWFAAALFSLVGFLLAFAHGVDQGALLGVGAAVLVVGALISQRDARAHLMTRVLMVGAATLSVAVWLVPAVT